MKYIHIIKNSKIYKIKWTLKYSDPSVSAGDWFQDPHGHKNPWMLKSLYKIA